MHSTSQPVIPPHLPTPLSINRYIGRTITIKLPPGLTWTLYTHPVLSTPQILHYLHPLLIPYTLPPTDISYPATSLTHNFTLYLSIHSLTHIPYSYPIPYLYLHLPTLTYPHPSLIPYTLTYLPTSLTHTLYPLTHTLYPTYTLTYLPSPTHIPYTLLPNIYILTSIYHTPYSTNLFYVYTLTAVALHPCTLYPLYDLHHTFTNNLY